MPTELPRQAAVATTAATATSVPEPHGTRLRILDVTGNPMPGSEYFHGSLPHASQTGLLECEAWRERWHPTDAWLTNCTRLVADADGHVTSYTTDTPYLYVARDGGRLAFWGWPFPDELRFVPERVCTVTVVDQEGKPVADAAVVLRNGRTSKEPILGVTDANGRCRIGHLECLQSTDWRDWRHADGHRLGIRGLGLRGSDVTLDAESPPEQLTVVLPPTGTIAVELLDPRGTRLASPVPVRLLGHDEEEVSEYTRPNGAVGFGHCAVNLPLTIENARGRQVAGPRGSGDRLVVQLGLPDLEPGGFVFTGRALTAGGDPLAHCELRTTFEYGRLGAKATTTADGRFVFVHEPEQGNELAACCAVVACNWRDGTGLVETRGALVQLPEPLLPGQHDLGDVRLVDAVVMVRGRVRGVGGATAIDVSPDYYSSGIDVRQQEDGRFEVRALPHRGRASLDVQARGYARQRVVTELPGADLDIVLQPQGACQVIATLDPGLAEFYESLRSDFVDAIGTRFRRQGDGNGQEWRCTASLPPGVYRCELRTLVDPAPLATVAGVVVAAGEGAPEIVRFDLRNRLRACRLSWVDAAGAPLHIDFAYVYSPRLVEVVDGARVWDCMRSDATGCTLLGTGAMLDVVVEADGVTGRHVGPLGNTKVRVLPTPTVAFHIPDLPGAPEGTEWKVRAVASAGDAETKLRFRGHLHVRPDSFTFGDVDAAGRGRIHLLPNSRYQIELLLSPNDESTRRFHALDATSGEVATGATPPGELVFRFDPQKVQAAIR